MEKYLLVILVIILVLPGSVKAAGLNNENIELNTGISYSNYLYQKYEQKEVDGILQKVRDENYFIREDLHQGFGYYGELIYWFNQELGVGIGGQWNQMTAKWESEPIGEEKPSHYKYTCSLDSYYAKLIYASEVNIRPYLNINYNFYDEHYKKENFDYDILRGQGLGLKVGIEYETSVTDKLGIKLNTGYNLRSIQITDKYSSYQGEVIETAGDSLRMTGLEVRGGIYYSF